jgi:hypothetical protein
MHVKRSTITENPDGTASVTLTFPTIRAALEAAEGFNAGLANEREAAQALLNDGTPADAESYGVIAVDIGDDGQTDPAPVSDKPATQGIDASGFDSAAIHVPGAIGEKAQKVQVLLQGLSRDPTFQAFARSMTANADPFAGDVQLAWCYLRDTFMSVRTEDEFTRALDYMLNACAKSAAADGAAWLSKWRGSDVR